MRYVLVTVAVAAGLIGSSCSKSTPSGASDTPSSSAVTMTASPDPAPSGPSSDSAYQWSTSTTFTLTEANGVAVTIDRITLRLEPASAGIVIAGDPAVYRPQVRAGGNKIPAKGSQSIGTDFFYTLPNQGREALITATVSLFDDKGYAYTVTAQAKVL